MMRSLLGLVAASLFSFAVQADDPLRILEQPYSPSAKSEIGPKVLFLGDSLTEGYGIPKEKALPYLAIERFNQEMAQRRMALRVEGIYDGVSGSTTASGLSRLKWHLKAKPDVLFLAPGAN